MYLPPDIIRVEEERQKVEWLGHVDKTLHEACIKVIRNPYS